MATKRLRSENFTFHDKEILVGRVKGRRDIIENKKTDHINIKAKEVAWKQIANEYNALATTPRTADVLRTCWENMKRRYRKSCTEENSNSFQSAVATPGCGHSTDFEGSLNNKIRDVLTSSLDKLQNSYDSDAVTFESLVCSNSDHDGNKNKSSDSGDSEEYIFKQTTGNLVKRGAIKVKKEDNERVVSYKSSKTVVPYVLTLTSHERTSEAEGQGQDNTNTGEFSPQRFENSSNLDENRHKSNGRYISNKRYHKNKNIDYALVESKLELTKLSKEHAIAEEKRKAELHELQLQETKLRIEILKLELLKKQSDVVK